MSKMIQHSLLQGIKLSNVTIFLLLSFHSQCVPKLAATNVYTEQRNRGQALSNVRDTSIKLLCVCVYYC